MRTKKCDVLYCGVDSEKIQKAHPKLIEGRFEIFTNFVKERYNIHVRKDVLKKKKPWTNDPILQQYRFTNVRREHDTETKWVIDNVTSNSDLSYEDKLLNCILFRLFNKHETAELLDMPIEFSENWNPESYRHLFKEALEDNPKRVFFTGAFNTGGLKRALKWYLPKDDPEGDMNMRMLWFIKYLMGERICEKISSCKSQKEVVDLMCSFIGLGRFLSYQIFVDFTYIENFSFSENEYTVAGPGCKRGLKYLFQDRDDMSYEECLFWIRDNWTRLNYKYVKHEYNKIYTYELLKDLPDWDREMNVMSLENCFCEFSKYMKIKLGEGRTKRKYQGV